MKKGFTLIELMAIFTLMGIILIITLPQMTSLLKKSGKESYENFEKSVYLATEAYIADKKINVTDPVNIYVSDIVASGYLKSTLRNPETNNQLKDMDPSKARVQTWRNDDGTLGFKFYES